MALHGRTHNRVTERAEAGGISGQVNNLEEERVMKTFKVEILRRKSQFSEWYLSDVIEIKAKTLGSALNKAAKLVNPYQIYGKVEEVK